MIRTLFALALILFSLIAAPPQQAPDLAALVNDAGIIVVGRVSSAAPDGSRALIEAAEYYKRGLPQFTLQVAPDCPEPPTADCLATQAKYAEGQQVILFLHTVGAGWTTLNGSGGKFDVQNGRVSVNGGDIGSLDDVKAQLQQLTGLPAATAPQIDPTPETTPVAEDDSSLPYLYIGVILAGVLGLLLMAVLAARIQRKG